MADVENRTTLLKSISDGFLPLPVRRLLFETVFFRLPPANTDVNGWSLVHAGSGFVAARYLGVGFVSWQYTHASWEAFQFYAGDNRPDVETVVDIAADTVFATAGWVLGRWWARS